MAILEKVENTCPYCNESLYINKRTFANHVRWCKDNPKYKEIRNSTISKLKKHKQKLQYTCNCVICDKPYIIECTENAYIKGNYRKTCSKQCANLLTLQHTDKEIKNQKIAKSLNKDKKFVICQYCGNSFQVNSKHKKFCCNEHAQKYKRYCKLPYITQLSDKEKLIEIKKIYKQECSFKFSLNDYPSEFNFDLIQQYGWYKPKNHGNNLNGISRDHIFSCNEAFKQLIDPYFISHPANCQLLQHNDNISKLDKCNITYEELIEKVNQWNIKYGKYPNKIDYQFFENINIQFRNEYVN